ncbi:MAG: hypothetical protein IT433_00505 [Phycisphaerales bacterium]|nr:hypothetical protein [Phycisphaerales bacterium]
MSKLIGLIAAAGWCAGAWAQPVPRTSYNRDVFVSDTGLDTVYLCRDLNGDGDANDPGEAKVFFDNSNAVFFSGAGAVFTIGVAADGRVFVGDGDTDSLYALRDLNDDGDANDEGEAALFFATASTLQPFQTPGGVAFGPDGVVYASTAGAGATLTADYVYRLRDLNADGDADDPFEYSVYIDLGALVAGSSCFDLAASGNKLFLVDTRGGAEDVIFVAEDTDSSGTIEAGELREFYSTARLLGPAIGLGIGVDGDDVYVVDSASSIPVQKVWRLHDVDGSGLIDQTSEVTEVWSEAMVPAGVTLGSAFDLAVGPPGVLGLVSSGTDLQDNVLVMTDLNADGDFMDVGETSALVVGNGAGLFADNARAVSFGVTPVAPCDPDLNQDGNIDQDDVAYLINVVGGGGNPGGIDPDFNRDGNVDQDDVAALIDVVAGGDCP